MVSIMKYLRHDNLGSRDFDKDFRSIPKKEIKIYIFPTNEIGIDRYGRKTCCQRCNHCFLTQKPSFHIPFKKANDLGERLKKIGYKVSLLPPDSFGDEIMAIETIPGYVYGALLNVGWTSGSTIILDDWKERLDKGFYKLGYRTIIMNGHKIADIHEPFKGTVSNDVLKQAIKNIHYWNNHGRRENKYEIGLTFTIRNDNYGKDSLRSKFLFCFKNNINNIRFNPFIPPSDKQRSNLFSKYQLEFHQIEEFYINLKEIFIEYRKTNLEVSIDTAFGNAGIDTIIPLIKPKLQKFGENLGVCNSGWKLFGLIELNGELVLTGCVETWEPIVAKVDYGGKINWDFRKIQDIQKQRPNLYGCWGGFRKLNRSQANKVIFENY